MATTKTPRPRPSRYSSVSCPDELLDTRSRKITTRLSPCRCGCKGADSWHKPTITRVVREVVAVDEVRCAPKAYGARSVPGERVVARGVARFPWSAGPVSVVAVQAIRLDGPESGLAWWQLEELRG